MFLGKRKDFAAVCVLSSILFACGSQAARCWAQSNSSKAKNSDQLTLGSGEAKTSPSYINSEQPCFKTDVSQFNQKNISLASIAALTWYSTEPVVMSASSFVYVGQIDKRETHYERSQPMEDCGTDKMSADSEVWRAARLTANERGDPIIQCPASHLTQPGRTQADDDLKPKMSYTNDEPFIDDFCVYGETISLKPFYSASAGGAGASSGGGNSKVPLTYRGGLNTWQKVVMWPLRPFLQPNATSISFSDQVGINATPRWSIIANTNPAWLPPWSHPENGGPVNYISLNMSTDLNNQINEDPNSTIGSLQWNLRSRNLLRRQWMRWPGLDISLTGAEYDFISNDVNLYFPSVGLRAPIAVLNHKANPAIFVWKVQLGELSGWHLRDPSANLAGGKSVAADIAEEGNQLFRGVAGTTVNVQGWGGALTSGLSINSSYQAMLPATAEPFTTPSSSSSKPPTVVLTDKARHFVKSTIAEKLGSSNFSLNITYQYGSLPPAFWLVKQSLMIGITLSSGNSRTE